MPDEEFEPLSKKVRVSILSPDVVSPALDWEHVRDMKNQSRDFIDLFEWIARCLRDTRAHSCENYLRLRDLEHQAS